MKPAHKRHLSAPGWQDRFDIGYRTVNLHASEAGGPPKADLIGKETNNFKCE